MRLTDRRFLWESLPERKARVESITHVALRRDLSGRLKGASARELSGNSATAARKTCTFTSYWVAPLEGVKLTDLAAIGTRAGQGERVMT